MKIMYIMLMNLLITNAVYSMQQQEQKQVQAAQQENKEAKAKTFEEALREEEEQRINKKYKEFFEAAQKFKEERCASSEKLRGKVQEVIDAGFLQQAKIQGRAVLLRDDETVKMNAERRFNTLITFGRWLFNLPEAEDGRIQSICLRIHTYLWASYDMPHPRIYDGIAGELISGKLVEEEAARKIADAFYGWSSI